MTAAVSWSRTVGHEPRIRWSRLKPVGRKKEELATILGGARGENLEGDDSVWLAKGGHVVATILEQFVVRGEEGEFTVHDEKERRSRERGDITLASVARGTVHRDMIELAMQLGEPRGSEEGECLPDVG